MAATISAATGLDRHAAGATVERRLELEAGRLTKVAELTQTVRDRCTVRLLDPYDAAPMPAPSAPDDPVRRRRATAERLARLASRAGYLLIAVAVVLFFVALATDFNATMAAVVTVALIAGCVLLAPAIIVGYAVKAAEREDAEHGL